MTGPSSPQSDPPSSGTADVQSYGLAAPLRARLMGLALAGLGAVLVVLTVAVALAGWPVAVLSVIVVLSVAGVFGLGFALSRRWFVLRLDQLGYRVRFVRGVGADRARWVDVLDLSTASVAGSRCVVLRLRDGRSTTVPVDLVEGDPEGLVRELGRRLAAAGR